MCSLCRQGDLERVKELLGKEETNVDMQDQDGATPLILAAIGNSTHQLITFHYIFHGKNVLKFR